MEKSSSAQPQTEKVKVNDKFISSHIFDSNFQQLVQKHWLNSQEIKTDKFEIVTKPFRVCRIHNFLDSPLGTYDLKGEFLSVHTIKRGTDLMQLCETVVDLTKVTPENSYSQNVEYIRHFCTELITDLRSWMKSTTNIKLSNKLSIRGSTYCDTDFLLCHNDKIEDRRIAFILYLSKDWKPEYGGALDLFDSDENGLPCKVTNSLYPVFNSFAFFEVTNTSYHQVREVIGNFARNSVNGWFHGEIIESDPPIRPERPLRFINPEYSELDLSFWIRDTRLNNDTFIELINKTIELFSFCGIKAYLKEEIHKKLSADVVSENIQWIQLGPPDERNYEIADEETLPENLKRFYEAFKSVAFCRLLNRYSELNLVPSKETQPKLAIELQRWSTGCYTVLHDGQLKRYHNDNVKDEGNNFSDDESTSSVIEENENNEEYGPEKMMEDIVGETSSEVVSSIISSVSEPSSSRKYLEEVGENYITNYDNVDVAINGKRKNKRSYEDDEKRQIKKGKVKNEDLDEDSESEPGTLDVVIYFYAEHAPKNTTLNYVDPEKEDGVCLTLPVNNNCLYMVYRQEGVLRHHEYVNHSCNKHFYSLVCSFRE